MNKEGFLYKNDFKRILWVNNSEELIKEISKFN
jgi:hypothetical protein